MRKYYFLVLGLLFFSGVKAQIVDIPDANFKARLLEASSTNTIAQNINGDNIKIDVNNDGEIEVSEALVVTKLTVSNSIFNLKITDLSGISSFTNLISLDCSNNLLSILDVTTLNNLKSLKCGPNRLSSLFVAGLANLEALDCSGGNLTFLDLSGLINLKSLECISNGLYSLDLEGLVNLETLNCVGNKIASLRLTNLVKLTFLGCYSNQLSSLDVAGLTNLKSIICGSNQLSSLDLSGLVNLETLDCIGNKLTSLNLTGLVNLNKLECSENKLTSLDVTSLVNLTYYQCFSNQLTSLDVNPLKSLTLLHCGGNQMNSLDVSSLEKLEFLYCSGNPLNTLDVSGLEKLELLDCQNNQLTSLNINKCLNLKYLSCGYNQLTSLDVSDNINIDTILLNNNQLSTLDFSSNINGFNVELNFDGLNLYFDVSHNPLTSIIFPKFYRYTNLILTNTLLDTIELPRGHYIYFNFQNNPNLSSVILKNRILDVSEIVDSLKDYYSEIFKDCPNLKYICADDSQIDDIVLGLNASGNNNCQVNSYCNFVPGGEFYTIQGNTKLDTATNGCDVADINYPNLKFSISDETNTGSAIANSTGSYSIPVLAGTHTITPFIENPSYFTVFPTNTVVTFPTQTSPFTQDFCIAPNGIHHDVEVTVLSMDRARPGFDASYKIIYKNKGNQTQSGSVNLTFDDVVLDLVIVNPIVSKQTLNNLSWNFTELKPFETREIEFKVNVNSPIETPAVNGGDILEYYATITSAATDETPTDNTFTLNQTVVNSFDPNDKTCLEGSTIPPTAIGKYVHYMIRFENKGTAEAENVVIKDMIDTDKFDISSLVVTQGSHPFVTKISETNKVEFIFEKINLPFDDATNDGYVAFKIKTKPSLVAGDSFSNTASIYFDYNFPIITNTATTSVLQNLGTQDFEFSTFFNLYPNPAKQILNIDVKKEIALSSISIFNTLGQQILVIPNAQKTKQVDVSSLQTGSYFIKVTSNKGSASAKFVRE